MILNLNKQPAKVRLNVYSKDRDPIKGVKLTAPAERVVNSRTDKPEEIGGVEIPRGVQYALRMRANARVVCRFGRRDATPANLAYYTARGLPE